MHYASQDIRTIYIYIYMIYTYVGMLNRIIRDKLLIPYFTAMSIFAVACLI